MAERRVLAGRYELDSLLGGGGMAEVYLGIDQVLGRQGAIKILRPQFAGDDSFVERFRREAQAAAALNHPNVVSVFDSGSDNSTQFIVMEYVQGRTLAQVIHQGPIMPERAVEIAEAVASALAFAHRAGFVHRDIKPANIMLTPSGDVKVMDFGIARLAASTGVTQTATVLGTASYFSPEQAQGEHVDARSDIYSLGCVVYEMLTSLPPFDGDTAVAIAYKHVRQEAEPPSRRGADVSPALDAIVMKCLAKNPANRYQSAEELRGDLERFRNGQAVLATPLLAAAATTQAMTRVGGGTQVLAPATITPRGRRNPWAIAGIVLVAGALLAALFFVLANALTGKNATTAQVPNVGGITLQAAEAQLKTAGFTKTPVVRRENSDTVPKGFVIRYSPSGMQPLDTTITLVVSSGPKSIGVPNVVCEPKAQAESDLRVADFVPLLSGHLPNASCPTPGNVAKQSPASPNGDTKKPKGSTVKIWLVPQATPTPPPTTPPPTTPSPTTPPPTSPSPT